MFPLRGEERERVRERERERERGRWVRKENKRSCTAKEGKDILGPESE